LSILPSSITNMLFLPIKNLSFFGFL